MPRKNQILLVFSDEEFSDIKKAWIKYLTESGGCDTLNHFIRKIILDEAKNVNL